MKGFLLDVNVLLALAWPNHVHHALAHEWFERKAARAWGTCLVTQAAFVRISSHPALGQQVSTPEAFRMLLAIVAQPGHAYWEEPSGGYSHRAFAKTMPTLLTHGLVTDGYLATLATLHDGKLATLDRQVARLFGNVAVLVGRP